MSGEGKRGKKQRKECPFRVAEENHALDSLMHKKYKNADRQWNIESQLFKKNIKYTLITSVALNSDAPTGDRVCNLLFIGLIVRLALHL